MALMVHGATAGLALLSWIFVYFFRSFDCPDGITCPDHEITFTWYSWPQLIAIIILIVSAVMCAMKKGIKLISILGIAGGAIYFLQYILQYFIKESGWVRQDFLWHEGASFTFILGRILELLAVLASIAAIAIPAFVGKGLQGGTGQATI